LHDQLAQRLSVLSSVVGWAGSGEKRVMEKLENDQTVSHLSHNPGYGYDGSG